MYHGDFALGKTFDIKFTTRRFSTGAPYTLAGSPAIAAYPDNSTTEVTAGITLTVDFDSRTGLNNVRVVATSGNGYATATNYTLVITAGTVDSVSVVGECIGSFSIEARSALRPATADRTLVVDAAGLADANAVKLGPTGSGTAQTARDIGASVLLSSGTGTGQLDFTSGVVKSNLVQIIATALTETSAGYLAAAFKKLFDVATPVLTSASVNQTGDNYARLGAPAGASVSADVAAVKTDTGNLVTRITSTLFSGITSLKEWLGLLAGKQLGNSTARTELRASGAGSGTFDETTDSLEALSDTVLKPATAGRTLVVDAAGLADANMVKSGPSGSGTAQTARDLGASVLLSNGTGTGQVKLSSGYVSPNWGDVGNPTTTVGLTGTTISTSQVAASVTAGVTVTTNNDKTGYTASTVSDKTGYSLASTGLDAVVPAEPSGVPAFGTATFTQCMAWLVALMRNKRTQTSSTETLRNNADNASIATSAKSDDGTTATRGKWS